MVSAWRNFKNIFSTPLFTIIFRPEMLKFHPYSFLTGDTRVEFVIYCVLMRLFPSPKNCTMRGRGVLPFNHSKTFQHFSDNQYKKPQNSLQCGCNRVKRIISYVCHKSQIDLQLKISLGTSFPKLFPYCRVTIINKCLILKSTLSKKVTANFPFTNNLKQPAFTSIVQQ